jgi:hypothetical protein
VVGAGIPVTCLSRGDSTKPRPWTLADPPRGDCHCARPLPGVQRGVGGSRESRSSRGWPRRCRRGSTAVGQELSPHGACAGRAGGGYVPRSGHGPPFKKWSVHLPGTSTVHWRRWEVTNNLSSLSGRVMLPPQGRDAPCLDPAKAECARLRMSLLLARQRLPTVVVAAGPAARIPPPCLVGGKAEVPRVEFVER